MISHRGNNRRKSSLAYKHPDIRGLRGSKAQLELTMLPTVIDIACFTETLIIPADGVSNGELLLDGYKLFRRDDKLLKIAAWPFTAGVDFMSLA